MPALIEIFRKTPEALKVYWMLARIIVPMTLLAEVLSRLGVIKAISPMFAPVMGMIGLPPELGLAWLSAMIVGLWGAIPLLFALVPVSDLSTADVTVFSALILFAHGLPIEQKIMHETGPNFLITTTLRVLGGVLYAFLLHHFLMAVNWLQTPVNPLWVPLNADADWNHFFFSLAESMLWMLVILVALFWSLELLKMSGLMNLIMIGLAPILRIAGIKGEATYLTSVGLFLGVSYGAGLLVQEAKSGKIAPKQIFLSCVFMGFAHSIVEDTLLVMALGADIYGVLVGRVIFAIGATAVIGALLPHISDATFFSKAFSIQVTKDK